MLLVDFHGSTAASRRLAICRAVRGWRRTALLVVGTAGLARRRADRLVRLFLPRSRNGDADPRRAGHQPADGVVQMIQPASPPPEIGMGSGR